MRLDFYFREIKIEKEREREAENRRIEGIILFQYKYKFCKHSNNAEILISTRKFPVYKIYS